SAARTAHMTVLGQQITVTQQAPLTITATGVNFNATAGGPFSGTVATFTTPDTVDGAGAFTAAITWGDATSWTGTITRRAGSSPVSGIPTYADPNPSPGYAVSVQITNPNTQSATTTATATVTSLGKAVQKGLAAGIGFWHNNNGQALINSFNGGSTSTAL